MKKATVRARIFFGRKTSSDHSSNCACKSSFACFKVVFIVFLLTAFFGFNHSLHAQNTLINPATDGGFNLGATFEANGWTVANYGGPNGWALGFAHNDTVANRMAYASGTYQTTFPGTGINTGYTTSPLVSFHFYKDVTVPVTDSAVEYSYQVKSNYTGVYYTFGWMDPATGLASNQVNPTNLVAGALGASNTNGLWQTVSGFLPSSVAGKTIRVIFMCTYNSAANITPANYVAVIDNISLKSRPVKTFISRPVTGQWTTDTMWSPLGVPAFTDHVVISSGTDLTASKAISMRSLLIQGILRLSVGVPLTASKTLTIGGSGSLIAPQSSIGLSEDFLLQPGAQADLSRSSLSFYSSNANAIFQFQSNNQFTGKQISNLSINGVNGLTIPGAPGKLSIYNRLMLFAGVFTHNSNIELNNNLAPGAPAVTIQIEKGKFATPVAINDTAKLSLAYSLMGRTRDSAYVVGSMGELPAGRVIQDLTVGSVDTWLRLTENLTITGSAANSLRLLGSILVDSGKTLFLSNPAFTGLTPTGFPTIATNNVFNMGHVQGGLAFTLNGAVANRCWGVGMAGGLFPFGMFDMIAENAVVRVEAMPVDSGTAAAGLSDLNPMMRWRMDLLSGNLSQVKYVTGGFNMFHAGQNQADSANWRFTRSAQLSGIYTSIGGPNGGSFRSPNAFDQFRNLHFIGSVAGNYNQSGAYSLALTNGGFGNLFTGAGGNLLWDNPANWSGGVLPTAADTIRLSVPYSTIRVGPNSVCASLEVMPQTTVHVPEGVHFKVGE